MRYIKESNLDAIIERALKLKGDNCKLNASDDANLLKMFFEDTHITMQFIGINRIQSMYLCMLKESYCQQSQRYVKVSEGEYFDLPFDKNSNVFKNYNFGKYCDIMDKLMELYDEMTPLKESSLNKKGRKIAEDYVHGIPIEDARYILPLSCKTNINVTMTLKNLFNFYNIYLYSSIENYNTSLMPLFADICSIVNNILDSILEDTDSNIPTLDIIYRTTSSRNRDVYINSLDENFSFIRKSSDLYMGCDEVDNMLNNNMTAIIYPNDGLDKIALCALNSSSENPIETMNKSYNDSTKKTKLVERVIGYGHTSILEAVPIITETSLSFCAFHQLIRHRMLDIKMCNMKDLSEIYENPAYKVYLPDSISENEYFFNKFSEIYNELKEFRKNIPASLRMETFLNCDRMFFTSSSNLRAEVEIGQKRLCNNAQTEIRRLYEAKRYSMVAAFPFIAKQFTPVCAYGKCPEGKMTCGNPRLDFEESMFDIIHQRYDVEVCCENTPMRDRLVSYYTEHDDKYQGDIK